MYQCAARVLHNSLIFTLLSGNDRYPISAIGFLDADDVLVVTLFARFLFDVPKRLGEMIAVGWGIQNI